MTRPLPIAEAFDGLKIAGNPVEVWEFSSEESDYRDWRIEYGIGSFYMTDPEVSRSQAQEICRKVEAGISSDIWRAKMTRPIALFLLEGLLLFAEKSWTAGFSVPTLWACARSRFSCWPSSFFPGATRIGRRA